MNKKFVILLLSIAGFLFGCDSNSNDKEKFEILYELDSTNTFYSIVGYKGETIPNEITIPSMIDQKPVKVIKNSAFSDCLEVEKITLPDSVIEIRESAFSNCRNLKEINIPTNIKTIEEKTFYRCEKLSTVEVNEELVEIQEEAFYGCKNLYNIDLPNCVNKIGDKAFMLCEGMIYFNIPEAVTVLENQVFSGCKSLMEIYVGNNVNTIGEGAFLNCNNIKSVYISDNVNFIENNVFSGCNSIEIMNLPFLGQSIDDNENQKLAYLFGEESYVPKTIKEVILTKATTLNDGAFINCESIEKIILPEELTKLNDNVFKNCSKLNCLEIKGNLEYIGISCFEGCVSLPYFEQDGIKYFGNDNNPQMVLIDIVDETMSSYYLSNQILSIEKDAFDNCVNAKEIALPNSLRKVPQGLLKDCVSLEFLSIPYLGSYYDDETQGLSYLFAENEQTKETLTSVEITKSTTASKNGFTDYKKLQTINFLNGIEKVCEQAFKGCSKLESVNLSNKLESIGYEAFYGCESIKEVLLPESIKEIKGYAFANCISLVNINIPETIKSINEYTFYNCQSLKEIAIPNSVSLIGICAFANCTSLLEAPIGNYTLVISSYAFSNCTSIKEVYIKNNVINLGSGAFQGCVNVEKIEVNKYNQYYDSRNNCNAIVDKTSNKIVVGCKNTVIDASIKIIGERAFYKMPIKQLMIPDHIETIENNAFEHCDKLSTITIEESGNLKSIGEYAFSSSAITSIYLPKTLTYLGEGAFFNCFSLKEVLFESNCSIKLIDKYTFSDCIELTSINIPESVNVISSNAFGGCKSLKELILPANLQEVGSFAFSGCEEIEKIIIPEKVNKIGEYAFLNCRSLTSISLPDSIQYIGDGAIYRCNSLQYNEYDGALYLGNEDNPYLVLIKAKNGFIENCQINEKCTMIYYSAFDSCKNLKEIIIPKSVKIISGNIFNYIDEINIFVELSSPCDQYQNSWNDGHKVYYYSETKPTEEGLYWHYEKGKISIW